MCILSLFSIHVKKWILKSYISLFEVLKATIDTNLVYKSLTRIPKFYKSVSNPYEEIFGFRNTVLWHCLEARGLWGAGGQQNVTLTFFLNAVFYAFGSKKCCHRA